MNPEFSYGLAFFTGLLGALHCLGMCSGIAGGFALAVGWRPLQLITYHATRIAVYALLGVLGAALGRVLVQSGIVGKGQGILMMGAGLTVMLIGLLRLRAPASDKPQSMSVAFHPEPRPWKPLAGGLLNGLVPCSLVFSVAVQAVAAADPLRAGLYMLSFGLGTLPAMLSVSLLGGIVGAKARGGLMRLAGVGLLGLGAWTVYEGWIFFDIMRGLGNW